LRTAAIVAVGSASLAQEPAPEPKPPARPFVRLVEEGEDGRLDVLVATYRRGEVSVTLHGSVHIADAVHYAELQRRFTHFDALLYELIAEEDVRPEPGMEADDDIWSLLYGTVSRGLGLAEQVACVDYRPANFVHADMTPDELDAALEEAGASVLTELLSSRPPEVDREAEAKLRKIDVVEGFRSGRGRHELRMMLARVLIEEEQRRGESVLIEGRNERCLAVLQEQIEAGKCKLGIYYGAAHMAHIERRLLADLGFERAGEEWLVAWDCSAARDAVVERGLQRKRYRAREDLRELGEAVARWQAERATTALPSWEQLRAAQPERKLPGRADGLDPWGRAYVLRKLPDGGFEVRSSGSDGVPDNEDDVVLD
jgi:hypothetical protein